MVSKFCYSMDREESFNLCFGMVMRQEGAIVCICVAFDNLLCQSFQDAWFEVSAVVSRQNCCFVQ